MATGLRNGPSGIAAHHAHTVRLMPHRMHPILRVLRPVFCFGFTILVASGASAADGDAVHTFAFAEDNGAYACSRPSVSKDANLRGQVVTLRFEGVPGDAVVEVKWRNATLLPQKLNLRNHEAQLRRPSNAEVRGKVGLSIDGGDNYFWCEDYVTLFEGTWSPLLEYDVKALKWWMDELGKDQRAQRTRDEVRTQLKRRLGREPTKKEINKELVKSEADKGAFFALKQRLQPDRPLPQLHEIKHYLVHLPSGAVAAPYPSDIRENDRTQVVVIIPDDQALVASLGVSNCDIPETFRVEFEQETLPKADDAVELDSEPPQTGLNFALHTVGPILRCGPSSLDYELTMRLKLPAIEDKRTTSKRLRINPKRHIAAVVAVGWDFAKDDQYFKGVREGEDEEDPVTMVPTTTSETFIDCRKATQGVVLYVGAQWMIGGVDYHNMKWWNYFANLFVAVNAASPLDDVALGLAFTPTGGISVAVGPTLHRRTYLADGFTKDQVFDDAGDIPTSRRWEKPVVGAFIGLAIDSNIFRALTAKKSD